MERSHIDITLLPRAIPCQYQRADSDDTTNHNSPLVSVVVLQYPMLVLVMASTVLFPATFASHGMAWHDMKGTCSMFEAGTRTRTTNVAL